MNKPENLYKVNFKRLMESCKETYFSSMDNIIYCQEIKKECSEERCPILTGIGCVEVKEK